MASYTEIQNKLNELANEYVGLDVSSENYHNEKIAILNKALKELLGTTNLQNDDNTVDGDSTVNHNLRVIMRSGKLQKLKTKWGGRISDCDQVIESACTMSLVQCFNTYDPAKSDSFMPYFMTIFYRNAEKDLSSAAKTLGIDIKSNEEGRSFYCNVVYTNEDDKLDIPDIATNNIEDSYLEKDKVAPIISLLASSIIIFCEHNNIEKSTIKNILKYYKTFYTGDIINLSKDYEYLTELSKHEQKIRKSYNPNFIDYVMMGSPRSLGEINKADLKFYKDFNNNKVPDSKLDKQIKIPIEQIIYSLFFDVSKPFISKKYNQYTEFKKDTIL